MPDYSLVDVDDSVLIVIDVQKSFVAKLGTGDGRALVDRIRWTIEAARFFGVPLVVTAEDIRVQGGAVRAVEEVLPEGTPVYDKMIFGLCDNPEILAAVEATGRRTAVLIGLETDVCVAHSAIGLLERGYRVVALTDATGSPGLAHQAGLERMRSAGVILTIARSLAWEWARGVENSKRFLAESDAARRLADGVVL